MGCGGKTLATVAGFIALPGSEMVRTAEGDLSVTIYNNELARVEKSPPMAGGLSTAGDPA